MNLEAKKLDLINWLSSLKDASVISQLFAIKNDSEYDWYQHLSKKQKKEIEKGLNDLDSGNTISNDDVMRLVKHKIEQLEK